MDWFTGIVAYLLIWWVTLFAVLPWGNHVEEQPEEGHIASAPAQPRILLKFMMTTGISIVLWCILYILLRMQLIDMFDVAQQMMIEDKAE